MKFFRETTNWGEYNTPNHIYLLSNDKSRAYGYIKKGTLEPFVFKKPYNFDVRNRTFKEVPELKEFELGQTDAEQSWTVQGSKGDKYLVEKINGVLQCSCTGYKYRGDCKHVKDLA